MAGRCSWAGAWASQQSWCPGDPPQELWDICHARLGHGWDLRGEADPAWWRPCASRGQDQLLGSETPIPSSFAWGLGHSCPGRRQPTVLHFPASGFGVGAKRAEEGVSNAPRWTWASPGSLEVVCSCPPHSSLCQPCFTSPYTTGLGSWALGVASQPPALEQLTTRPAGTLPLWRSQTRPACCGRRVWKGMAGNLSCLVRECEVAQSTVGCWQTGIPLLGVTCVRGTSVQAAPLTLVVRALPWRPAWLPRSSSLTCLPFLPRGWMTTGPGL